MPWKKLGSGYTAKDSPKGKGGFVRNTAQYEKLRAKGMSKGEAAAISNKSKVHKMLTPYNPVAEEPKPKGLRFEDLGNRARNPKGQFVSLEIGKRLKPVLSGAADKILFPTGVAIAGGVTANQFPQNRRSSKAAKKKLKDELKKSHPAHKAQVVPLVTSEDPYFNKEYAQKMANLVSKMDDEEAYLFTTIVMDQVLNEDIEKNLKTLQRHLDEVVEKRLERLKKGAASAIAKGASNEEAEAYAEAISQFETLISKEKRKNPQNPYTAGFYHFEESDFRRDPETGRFMRKIIPTSGRGKPLGDKQAQTLGINTEHEHYAKLKGAKKKHFQNEYMQVANFVNTAQGMHPEGTRVRVKVSDGNQQYWKEINGKPKPGDWDAHAGERVLAVEAIPERNLSLGGAAFSLAPAMSRDTMQTINRSDQYFGGFANDWHNDAGINYRNSNDRLYSRTKRGGEFLSTVAPAGSKAHVAGQFARAVGEHGPEAEKVIGPTVRRTAYRYRGIEKKPDADAVSAYRNAQRALASGEGLSEADQKSLGMRQRRAVTAARGRKAAATNTPVDAVELSREETRSAMERATRGFHEQLRIEENPNKVSAPTGVLIQHLMDPKRSPSKKLYGLQLESGVTPPSEGFIIDKTGNVVTQAVGYGDDHYLPFNLKHLAKLRGGEYVRRRSVGGLTSEDIYTGLMAGARRVTVVSRSGVFTVNFKEDFKGKRRYNDKALRMTRRYENILDTVQSEKLERNIQVPDIVRQRLSEQVRADGYTDRGEFREEMRTRQNEYKKELSNITDESDLQDLIEDFVGARKENEVGDLSAAKQREFANAIRADWRDQNEFYFKLNGAGYRDAQAALQEQFPYYFDVGFTTLPDKEGRPGRLSPEGDKGYVEPGRNRPTDAKAGLYGYKGEQSQKFRASEANYQRGRKVRVGDNTASTNGGTLEPSETQSADDKSARKAEIAGKKAQVSYLTAAVALQQAITNAASQAEKDDDNLPFVGPTADDAREMFRNPQRAKEFDQWFESQRGKLAGKIPGKVVQDYVDASGRVDRRPWDPDAAFTKGKPFIFEGKAYEDGASESTVQAKAVQLTQRTQPLTSKKKLGEMSDDEINTELDALGQVWEALDGKDSASRDAKMDYIKTYTGVETVPGKLLGEGGLLKHVEDVQRMRALNLNRKVRAVGSEPAPKEVTTPPESKDDPVQAARRAKMARNHEVYKVAGEYWAARNEPDLADQLSSIAASLEDALQESVITETAYNSMANQLADAGLNEKAMEGYHKWETREPARQPRPVRPRSNE